MLFHSIILIINRFSSVIVEVIFLNVRNEYIRDTIQDENINFSNRILFPILTTLHFPNSNSLHPYPGHLACTFKSDDLCHFIQYIRIFRNIPVSKQIFYFSGENRTFSLLQFYVTKIQKY